jgi:hypothetical protein
MTPSRAGQYVTGMCIAGLGVCTGGWLVVTAFITAGAVDATTRGNWDHAAVTLLATGAGLALVAAVTFACWATAWRKVLRADGVLTGEARRRSRQQARRQARQAARAARLEAAVARRQARQARREARAMEKRERAHRAEQERSPVNVALERPASDVESRPWPDAPDPVDAEPDPVRPPNADRVLAQLRDLLGPLLTALDADAEPPGAHPRRRSDLVSVGNDAEEAW